MITAGLKLNVGCLINGKFRVSDYYLLESDWEDPVNSDNINSLLAQECDSNDYAELMFYADSVSYSKELLIGSFKRIKIKGKGFKWILVD